MEESWSVHAKSMVSDWRKTGGRIENGQIPSTPLNFPNPASLSGTLTPLFNRAT
jgi:hypothetical protein